jgi:hypothetical protein
VLAADEAIVILDSDGIDFPLELRRDGLAQVRRHDFSRLRARHDWNELERHADTTPLQNPLLQKSRIVTLHMLKRSFLSTDEKS